MKRVDYKEIKPVDASEERLILNKYEHANLPPFTRDLPLSRREQGLSGSTVVSYQWGRQASEEMRIRLIEFRKDEPLGQVYRFSVQDGEDTVLFRQKNALYVLRKTALAVAQSLYRAYSYIKSVAESIVGYLKTLGGNAYVISRLHDGMWTFDHALAKNGSLQYLSAEQLTSAQKSTIVDLVVKKLSFLHSKRLVFGQFSLRNLLLTDTGSYFTDMRSLRISKKASLLVKEFTATLRYLFSIGIAAPENVYPLVAAYCVANEAICREWYSERSSNPPDTHAIANMLEEEIVS